MLLAWRKGYKLSLTRTAKLEAADPVHTTHSELPLGGHHEKSELPAKVVALQKPNELSGDSQGPRPVHELYTNER